MDAPKPPITEPIMLARLVASLKLVPAIQTYTSLYGHRPERNYRLVLTLDRYTEGEGGGHGLPRLAGGGRSVSSEEGHAIRVLILLSDGNSSVPFQIFHRLQGSF